MADPLSSSRYSIAHAQRRINELDREIVAFRDSNPYAGIIEVNADRTEDIHKVKLAKPMPVGLPGIAFDVLNALRSALDQAGYSVAIAAGGKGKKAHFPFGDTRDEVLGRRNGKGGSIGIPEKIFDVMVSFEPYKGGKGLLWAVNELCNTNKHEVVTPLLIATGDSQIGHFAGDASSFSWPPDWDIAKQEMEIVRVPHGTTPRYNLKIQIDIVTDEAAVTNASCILVLARTAWRGKSDALLRKV